MSLALEKLVETPLTGVSFEAGQGAEAHPLTTPHRFMAHVRTVTTAFMYGGRLEGAKLLRVSEEYGFGETLWARVVVRFDTVLFYIYAKPFFDVPDVDVLVDEAAEEAEKYGVDVVPVAAAYEYTYDAERYAKSLEVEVLRLGY